MISFLKYFDIYGIFSKYFYIVASFQIIWICMASIEMGDNILNVV